MKNQMKQVYKIDLNSVLLNRYVPNHMYLGIQELDESHVGRFSFRSREGVMQV